MTAEARCIRPLVALPLAGLTLLMAACSGDEPSRPSGIARGPVATRDAATVTATSASTARATATATFTPLPIATIPTGTPTDVEVALAELAGENPAEIAGVMEALLSQCTDERAVLGDAAARTWRLIDHAGRVHMQVTSILGRIASSLPVDGRRVECVPLFASLATELTR